MATSTSPSTSAPHHALERRLLQDIAEIQQDPYPNVYLYFSDADIRKACLILTPQDEAPLHLKIDFGDKYPLQAPKVTIQSRIQHPNVFGSYICATMLNTEEGWTPAYTLKGVVIQLLSFFCSDTLEQDHGYYSVDLAALRRERKSAKRGNEGGEGLLELHLCSECGFGPEWTRPKREGRRGKRGKKGKKDKAATDAVAPVPKKESKLFTLPDEIVLSIFEVLETRDIYSFADAVPSIKRMVYSYDFIRVRELQCFCLKKSFMTTKLGIGVAVEGGKRPVFRSEFDLISQEAVFQHGIRRSVQGVDFHAWLPLPLSRRHWNQVREPAVQSLRALFLKAEMKDRGLDYVDVLYHFMNNIVVQFSADAERGYNRVDGRSTLSHASEKAVEAYFTLYHLLLCLPVDNLAIVSAANRMVASFTRGPRTKNFFPDLGHVLVAALISTQGLNSDLTLLIIKEAILRNVVWMLDAKGAGFLELAYVEPNDVSEYRLAKTFAASPTSYRLLMFAKMFSDAARGSLGKESTLLQRRDALFNTHGAPPPGTASRMAQRIRQIRDIKSFPAFLNIMGVEVPAKSAFCAFLRRTITESVEVGYSCHPLTQSQLFFVRREMEKDVRIKEEVQWTDELARWWDSADRQKVRNWSRSISFFPSGGERSGRGRGGLGMRGRGMGRGRGR